MGPLEQFRSIAKGATERLAQTSNAPDLVPYGNAMLELIAKHPEQRQVFGQAFLEGIRSREEFDPWLIEFCMHALRWPELKNEFTAMSAQAVARNDWSSFIPWDMFSTHSKTIGKTRESSMPNTLHPMAPNSALLTDAFRSLRCACGAAKRER